jgi:hypothetical protein
MRKTLAAALFAAAIIPRPAQALENEELLALVAMPLAVAAVSEVTDVPVNDLIDVVSLMNDAAVPPAQFIEVVRYAPVALVVEAQQPSFPVFVQTQFDNGLRGTALVSSIETHFQSFGVHGVDLDVVAPRVIDVDENFVPQIVRTRIAERKSHPHGGPPGQLKKERGLQTGAEVVHGERRGRGNDEDRAVTRVVTERSGDKAKHRGRGGEVRVADDRGSKGHGHSGNKGKGHGKGKGKG